MRPTLVSSSFMICALLGLAAIPFSDPASAEEKQRRTVSLTATGTVKAAPDLVEISTGVTTQAETARAALDANNEAMTKVVEALKAEGIEAKDIQTTNFSVEPLYEQRNNVREPKVYGYRASNMVHFRLRDIPKLGEVLDRVVSLGSNQIGGISFTVEEPEPLKDKARKEAMRNAMARAKLYAEAAGAELGEVLTINEEQDFYRPYARAAVADAAAPVPIEPGTASVEVRLSVSWELK